MVAGPDWFSPDPRETVVWTGKPRVRRILPTVAGAVVWSAVGLVAAWAAVTYGPDAVDGGLPVPAVAVWGLAAVWVLVQAGSVVRAYLRTRATDYVLTDRNVYKKTGVVSENVTQVDVAKIQNTELRKSVTGNLFDWGTVLLSTAGGGGTELSITDLDDPESFQAELGPLVDRAGGPGRDAMDAAGGGPALDPEVVEAMLPEARQLREASERFESRFDP